MKRILCLIFTALTLISLTIPALADTTTFDDLPALDMDNTSIEYDFEHVFLDDYSLSDYYPNSLKSDVELITMAEKGFNEHTKNLLDIDKFIELIQQYDTIDSSSQIVEVDGRKCIMFRPHHMAGKSFADCFSAFEDNTRYIFSCEAKPNTLLPEDYQYDGAFNIGFKGTSTVQMDGLRTLSAKTTTEFERMYVINSEGSTVTDIILTYGSAHVWLIDLDTVYLYKYENNDNPDYEPYGTHYGLYFYLYNPGMLNIVKNSENNLVQFGSNVTGGIKTDPRYKKHQLKLVDTYGATEESDTHTNALVLKFSLLNYDDFIFLEEFTSRFYDVSGIELVIDENSNATEYGVAQVFEFYKVNGFPTCSIDKTEVLRIDDLAFSFYRVKSDVPNVYKDLQSVSFSIPNTIINKYGEINALHAVWEECLTQPVLIVDDIEVRNEFKNILNQEVTSDFPYCMGYGAYCKQVCVPFQHYKTFIGAFNDNINIAEKEIKFANFINDEFPYDTLLDKLYFAFYAKDVFNPNLVCVTSDQMMAKLDEYKWSDEVFSSIDKTNFDLENPTLYDVTMMDELGVYRVPTFWEGITLGGFRNVLTDHKKYDNIETIDIKDKELNEDDFAEDYLVFEDDVEKIQDLMSTDSTTYILHYTATDYITHEAFIYDAESDKPVCNAIVGQATAIRNFDFIDMYFKKGDVVTCLAIGGDPQNFAPAFTGYEKTLPGDRWAEFLESLEKLLGIAIILAVITIALKIFTMLKKTKVKVVVKNEKSKR